MRGLIRLGLAGTVVVGAVMTASPAHAEPGHGVTTGVVRPAAGHDRVESDREVAGEDRRGRP